MVFIENLNCLYGPSGHVYKISLQITDKNTKWLTANGEKDDKEEFWEEELVGKEEAKDFRGLSARMNFMSQDGPDLQFPIKVCSREMGSPKRGSWKRMKKLARYLVGRKKVVWDYVYQEFYHYEEECVEYDALGF